ncbi:MAG: metallopeptidase family protein [Mycobacterium sp.]|uniref:metallopeptidase family protein n=1 Tax=Mycobacterium sp. TaxID=1785 RepID=UPI003BB20B51
MGFLGRIQGDRGANERLQRLVVNLVALMNVDGTLVVQSGTIAEMDARSGPGLNDPFEAAIDDALSSLPDDLRAAMSNVEIIVEDEPPDGQPLLGLYRGVPLPRRTSTYSGVLPDKISIFGGPITRLAAGDADRLRREVRHVVLHEIAHHFGISDERLIELDRY